MAMKRPLHGHYILDDELREVPCPDLLKWARWFEVNDAKRRIGEELIGPYWVSTVFLALDHNYWPKGPPLLYETMIFRRINADEQHSTGWINRYSTYTAAQQGHAAIVALVKQGKVP